MRSTKAHPRRPFNQSNGRRLSLFQFFGLLVVLIGPGPAQARPNRGGPSALARALADAAPQLRWDASLSKAAEHHAHAILAHPNRARLHQVKKALAREGVADANVLPFSRLGQNEEGWAAAARRFTRIAVERGFNRFGFSRVRHDLRVAWVVVVTRRLAALSPLPPQSGPRGVKLAGRVGGPYELLLLSPCGAHPDCPRGQVTRLAHGPPGPLSTDIPPLRGDRSHVLELLVQTERGPEIAALWTFGGRWPPPPRPPSTGVEGLFTLLVQARNRAAVPPLTVHDALERAARAHARSVCARRVAAHVLARGAGPVDRARAAGYRGRISENIAVAADIRRAHQNLMWSPGHRRVRLDPTVVHVGQAAVFGAALDGLARPVCVVEMFGRPPPPERQLR